MKRNALTILLLVAIISCGLSECGETSPKNKSIHSTDLTTTYSFDEFSVNFPGTPTVDTFSHNGLTAFFVYFTYDDGTDTIVYSAQYVNLPEMSLIENCFKRTDCITDYYDKGIQGALNNGTFDLIEREEPVFLENHSWTSFSIQNRNDGMVSKARLLFTASKNLTLQVVGRPQALKKVNPTEFFDTFRMK